MRTFLTLIAILLFAASFSAQAQKPAPPPLFKAAAMDGQIINSDDLKGKVVVLNIWFVNCPNCIEEIGLLNQLVDQYQNNKDVVFIGLAASTKVDLEKFLAKHPFKYQVIPNASVIILSKFGTPDKTGEIDVPFPMHYVLDRSGKVVVKVQGIKGVDSVKSELTRQFALKTAMSN